MEAFMKYLVDRPDFKLYMKVDSCVSPTDLRNVTFTRELWDVEKNVCIMTSTFELFIPRKQLNELAAQLIENS
jgi:hypothetical protein